MKDMDANAANPEVNIEELLTPKVSISADLNTAYVFFGKTPRAQLTVTRPDTVAATGFCATLRLAYPYAKITYQ